MKRKHIKRTMDITAEIKEVLLVSGFRGAVQAWCSQCARQVCMLTPEEAAAASGTDARAIAHRVKDGTLHWTATNHGLRICVRSLSALGPEANE